LQGSSWVSDTALSRTCNYYRGDGYVELYKLTPSAENEMSFLSSIANNTYTGDKKVLWAASVDGGTWESFRGMRFGTLSTPLIRADGKETLSNDRPSQKNWFHIEVIDNDTIDLWNFKNNKKEKGVELKTKTFTRVANCDSIAQQLPIKLSELERPIW